MQSELQAYGDGDGTPTRCLSLTVAGPWGHFRRVDGNTVKATYRLPPRTTVAGLLAAIAGYERDGYYDVFDRERSDIAIQPVARGADPDDGRTAAVPRTMNLPEISLTTSGEGMKAVNSRGTVSVRYPDPTVDRQRSNYEVLVDPAYRIDVRLADGDAYERLRDRLSTGRSEYTPSLGLSEFLATIRYHGEFTPERVDTGDDPIAVHSAIPDPDGVIPDPDHPHGVERSPGDMTRTEATGEFSGRKTTEYLRWAYSKRGDLLKTRRADVHEVGGRRVVFS